MSEAGEKTEKPTAKRLEDAIKKGQIPRSAEVQTVFVLGGGVLALAFSGRETWHLMGETLSTTLGHLHESEVSLKSMQGYAAKAVLTIGHCVWPVVAGTMTGGLLAGAIQSRFRTASEALTVNWEKLNPVQGLQRLFSMRSSVATGLGLVKLSVVLSLCYGVIKRILDDPIFHTRVDVAGIAAFMAESSFRLVLQVGLALTVIAAADYTYKIWQSTKDLMMSKEEVKEETKNAEGNQQVKNQRRRRRLSMSKRKMLAQVPKADVVVTNPTRIAIALQYDRKTMKAPRIVAKGIRLNALQIREIAQQHQIPIVENKPLAQLMFKYGRVGGEIPAQLYAAVAEILAWVYRVNAYRYYREQSM
jgi:flagellar biosynthetic protein FlhB